MYKIKMRIRLSDAIIELARQHPDKKREIYWDAIAYLIDHEDLKRPGLLKYLDPNLRRSENMKDKKNRLGHTKNKTGTHLNNKCGTDLNLSVGHTKKDKVKTTKKQITDEALTIYINNNTQLYDIVNRYITSNINTWNISYLISKHWELNYIYTQMKEAEKVIKQIGIQNFTTILSYIKQDEFWSKQILSIAKLNRKDKDGVPYYVIIMDKIKQYKPKVISIPTV